MTLAWVFSRLLHRRLIVAVWACALMTLAGCHGWNSCWDYGCLKNCCCRIPKPQKRSIEELYFEALSQAKPEQNLGMEYPPSGQPAHGTEYPTPHPAQPDYLAPAPQSLPPAASPTQAATRSGGASPATAAQPNHPGILPVTHVGASGSSNRVFQAGSTKEKLVSDIFTETDIREAIQSLSSQARVTIVLDDTARGEVTCTIENEPFEIALRRILLPLGLVYAKKDNLYLIGTNDPSSNLFTHIAEKIEYRPNHLSAQELTALLPPRQAQFVRLVDKRNLVVIEAPHDIAQSIYAQLISADQPIPQIMIEAIICVTAPEKGLQFGIDWNHVVKVDGLDAFNVGLTGLSFTGAVSSAGGGNAFDDFAVTSAFIKLLAKEGYVTIRAAPRVMAKDGEKAEISIARDTFFSIQQANNQFLFNQNIQKVESGISLNLTPAIRGDTIQIVIEKAEVSEDIRSIDPQQQLINNPYPIINRRNVSTTVQVKDRQTIVIGGLVARQSVDRHSQVPVLGDIPIVGALFRKVEKQDQDAEVAIFLSPQIVVPTAQPSLSHTAVVPSIQYPAMIPVEPQAPAVAPQPPVVTIPPPRTVVPPPPEPSPDAPVTPPPQSQHSPQIEEAPQPESIPHTEAAPEQLPVPQTPPAELPHPEAAPVTDPATPETTQTSGVIPLELVIPGS